LDCGVDDLGGVSPVTDDYINPDYAWPALRELEGLADDAGVPLHERLPVYERFLAADRGSHEGREWVSGRVREAIAAEDDAGRRYRACLTEPTRERVA
jgi:FO synthase subunit 1